VVDDDVPSSLGTPVSPTAPSPTPVAETKQIQSPSTRLAVPRPSVPDIDWSALSHGVKRVAGPSIITIAAGGLMAVSSIGIKQGENE